MSIERNLFFQQELDSGIFSWENSHYLFDWREKVESKLRKTEEIAENYCKDDTLGSNEIPGPICIKFVREPIVSRWSKEKKLKKKHHSVDMKYCDICNFKTQYSKRYLKHLFELHEQTMCDQCGKSFENFPEYYKHYPSHLEPIQCPMCPKTFLIDDRLTFHITKVHIGEKNKEKRRKSGSKRKEKSCCPICGKNVVRLNAHLRLHETKSREENKIQCPNCDYTSFSKNDMNRHIKKRHTEVCPVNCPWCGALTKDLHRHLREKKCNIPEEERPKNARVTCEFCGKDLKDDDALGKHLKYMHDENVKQYQCDLCGYKTKRLENLRMHIKRVHERKALKEVCPVCSKVCVSLQWHMDTYHPVAKDSVKL